MNKPASASMTQRSPVVRTVRALFTRRSLRRFLIALAWLVTVAALFYGIENWRGRKAWNDYRQKLEARGETLDLKALISSPIPDSENFAATPFVRSWFTKGSFTEWNDRYSKIAGKISSFRASQDKTIKDNRDFMDLVAWNSAFAAVDSGETNILSNDEKLSGKLDRASREKAASGVLAGLKDVEPKLEELRAASQRTNSRYPVVYDLENPWGIQLPHLQNLRAAVSRLQLKACAELAAGHTDRALDDIRLMLRLGDTVTNEPLLISYLVRVACIQSAMQPVWEGLAEHRWSESQLQELQTRFADYNFFADIQQPLAGERAMGILTPDLIQKKGLGLLIDLSSANPSTGSHTFVNFFGSFIPSGWYSMEKLNYCRMFQKQADGTFDPNAKKVWPAMIRDAEKKLEREVGGGKLGRAAGGILKHQVIASVMLPSINSVLRRAAIAQTSTDHAALACALERYRLAKNEFPDELEKLAPEFMAEIPRDVVTAELPKYARTNDGGFRVYSVGWNESDDGGKPEKMFDKNSGDWVWEN